jgi:primosomal protein N' (replication factor Y)
LLRGVTGSGKTEVYLRAIAHARAQGRGAVVLVPEIALTAQLEARFRARFGDQVVVLHSAISEAERRRRWHRLRSGEARIALGARSAIWSPVADLGVIVVDEEHEPSFKQHNELRYNGRDLALFRAHRAQAVAILGSATPSLETRHLAEQGRITELRLAARVAGRAMPAVQVVDLQERRQGRDAKGEIPLITRPLGDALREVVARNEQAIIFLNRRGFNTIVVCDECQSPRRCPDCDVSLTHHKQEEALICHYCGHREPMRAPCPSCGARQMKPFGAGTERIAEAVREAAPDATVARLDRDVTSKAGAMQEVLDRFRSGLADVLVGTQMVTKGHDFPRVTLVGIICADTSLAFPDFRAAERTFQLLTQVAGRAGRAELPGRVVIQTFQPKHYALTCALAHDDQRFFQLEMTSRRSAGYPPVARMALVRLESGDAERLGEACRALRGIAGPIGEARGVRVRGPAPAPIARIKNRHRAQLMLLAPTPATLIATLRGIKEQLGDPRGVEVGYDVDPLDML